MTQKLGILAISSDLFWKNGWRSLLYFCSTLRISSLACSFNLKGEQSLRSVLKNKIKHVSLKLKSNRKSNSSEYAFVYATKQDAPSDFISYFYIYKTHNPDLKNKKVFLNYLSISFWTSSMCSIASCCSFSVKIKKCYKRCITELREKNRFAQKKIHA